jgi:hypothetical protein
VAPDSRTNGDGLHESKRWARRAKGITNNSSLLTGGSAMKISGKLLLLPVLTVLTFFLAKPVFLCAQASGQEGKILPEKRIPEVRMIRFDHIVDTAIPVEKIKAGTTVVWINDLTGIMLEIQFTGKQVTLACKSPVHFIVDEDGMFISNKIPFGAVASLCFVEKGAFDYTVKRTPRVMGPSYGLGPSGSRQPYYKDLIGKILVE